MLFVGSLFFIVKSSALAFSGSGSGTSGDPYQVTTCSQLHEIASNLSAYYLLKNDVDCNGFSWIPIGDTSSNFFVGTLDGGGHKITNFTINSDTDGVGMFQEMGSGGLVTNIGVESGSITSGIDASTVGTFAGEVNAGTITKSYSKATITGANSPFASYNAGGLAGNGDSATVSDSYYSGTITNNPQHQGYSGGIVGNMNGGSITRSYSTGSITQSHQVGGITGNLNLSATVSNSFSTMTITNSSNDGGLIGHMYSGTVTNSYWNKVAGGQAHCNDTDDTGCTAINNNVSYFYTVTNAPMSSWDFVSTWSTINTGTNYPLLYWQSPNPTPTPIPAAANISSGSVSTPSCGNAAPTNSPNLFQVTAQGNTATLYFVPVSGPNNKYYVSYGLNSNAEGFGVEFNYSDRSGVIPYTINYLFPGTWYFKVRGGNGCMPGNWSAVMSTKVGLGSVVKNTNTVLGVSTIAPVTGAGKCTNYTVQVGDSLWGIATSLLGNGTKYPAIMHANALSTSRIHTGQILKVGC